MFNVIVTGGTSGIGLSTVTLFLERGWNVVFVGTNKEKGTQVEKQFVAKGYKTAYFFPCNVSKDLEVKQLYEFALQRLGSIDSVINNAGIWAPGELHETEEEMWDRLFAVNVKSIYLLAKYVIPQMIKQGKGSIVNTASVSGLRGDFSMAAYNASKGAVVNLVRAMALDYGKYNIRVNNVCPSACGTPMFLSNPSEVIELFKQSNPLGKIATPEEVAQAILFLASDESSHCNGVNLPLSGGLEVQTGQPVQ